MSSAASRADGLPVASRIPRALDLDARSHFWLMGNPDTDRLPLHSTGFLPGPQRPQTVQTLGMSLLHRHGWLAAVVAAMHAVCIVLSTDSI